MTDSRKRTVSVLEAHTGFWLRFVSNHVSERFQALLETEGTSVTEWVALRTLFDHAETSNAELIQALGMTKGATSKVVSRLEDKGLATRCLADGSAREQTLRLTRTGLALVPRLAALADENDAHFFGHLSQRQHAALVKSLRSLAAHHQIKEIPIS
jgi:DNA-binding MarR family transcriptional regulator